jgi:hypothetical protein
MARKSAAGPAAEGKKNKALFAPKLVVAAAMLAWAAANEPQGFDAASVAVWALTALTVGLLASAAIALAGPVTKLVALLIAQTAARPDEAEK